VQKRGCQYLIKGSKMERMEKTAANIFELSWSDVKRK
jgi:hypothetical protein